MKRADISDEEVVRACRDAFAVPYNPSGPARPSSLDVLCERFPAAHWKVAYRAMERTCQRGLIEYGVCLSRAWAVEKS
jgi:hypothetical protein